MFALRSSAIKPENQKKLLDLATKHIDSGNAILLLFALKDLLNENLEKAFVHATEAPASETVLAIISKELIRRQTMIEEQASSAVDTIADNSDDPRKKFGHYA